MSWRNGETPTFHAVSFDKIDRLGSIQWPCNEKAPEGTPVMHVDEFVRGTDVDKPRNLAKSVTVE